MSAIYHVKTPNGDRLIEASNKQTAINFAVKSEVTAESITALECISLMRELNIDVEKAEFPVKGAEAAKTEPAAQDQTHNSEAA